MYKFITSEIATISPKEATSLLKYNVYPGQRGIKKQHVADLANRMQKGMFTVGSVCLAHYLNGDNGQPMFVLMDGQHTLNAVIKSDSNINVVIERVSCKDSKDLALLYQQKDGGVSRSLQDYVVAEKNALNINWPTATASLIVAAVAIINNYTHQSKAKKIELLEQYIPDGEFIIDILGDKRSISNAHLWRAPVISTMILTYRSDQGSAEVFWKKVRSGEMLMNDDPQFVLRNFLVSHNRVNNVYIKPVATQHEFMYKCIYSWNAYMKQKKVKIIKYIPSYPLPKIA